MQYPLSFSRQCPHTNPKQVHERNFEVLDVVQHTLPCAFVAQCQ